MDWLKKLAELLVGGNELDVKVHAENKIDTRVNTKKNSDNKEQNVSVNIGTVNILNVKTDENGRVDQDVLEQLRGVVLPEFEAGNLLTLQDDSKELLSGIGSFRQEELTKSVLDFFRGKISQSDLRLVESGLYEAYLIEHDQIDKAKLVKSGLQNKYGTRGLNIVNLASRGYFSTHIRQLYEALDEVNRAEDFHDEYEQILKDLPFAIFVSGGMNEETLLIRVMEKAEKNIKFGVEVETITINGFGSTVDTIEKLIPLLKEKFERVASVESFQGKLKTVQVTVYYRERKESQ
jgi:hypothetical protein